MTEHMSEINMEQSAIGTQHNIAVVPIRHSKSISSDATGCAGCREPLNTSGKRARIVPILIFEEAIQSVGLEGPTESTAPIRLLDLSRFRSITHDLDPS